MEPTAWRPLGELIVERGLISQEDLEDALLEQRITHKRLGTILIDKGIVTAQQLTDSLVDQIGVEELLDELDQSENGESEQKSERPPRSLGAPLRRFRTRLHIDLPAPTRIAKPFSRIGAKAPLGHRRHDAPVAPFAPFSTPPTADEPEEPFENAVLELVEYDRADPEPEPDPEPELELEPEAVEPEPEPEAAQAELHAWLTVARRALDDAEVEINRLDNFAIARAVELEEARAELAGHRAEAAAASEAHARAEEEIDRLHALIDERDAGLTAMEGTVEEVRAELEAATGESHRRGKRVTELEVRVAELAENLSATDETLGIEMQAREHAQRESKRLHEELDDRDARVAKLARQVEALEKELEVVVAEREQATRKLRSHERRVTKLESTLSDLRVERERTSVAPAAERVEVGEPMSEPLKPEAKAEPKPKREPEAAAQQTEGFLYFMPRSGEGYELVEQPGSAPAVGETIELDGKTFEVTRHSRSPLPFDRRICVYLRVS